MRKLNLKCTQHQPYKSTTNSSHNSRISSNVLDQQFNPDKLNQVWSTDITCLLTRRGWVYLAIVMDLHSRKIVGWPMAERMGGLIMGAFQHAYVLRKPPRGLLHHSDRGSQYTSRTYRKQLDDCSMQSSMNGRGNYSDNAVAEQFFGNLKHEWLAKVLHLITRDRIINDVNQHIRDYNGTRLHATFDYQTPNEHENSQINVCN